MSLVNIMTFRTGLLSILIGVTLSVNSAMASDTNVYGNGQADALTDGILVLRHQFGLSGSALVDGVLAPDASVTDAEAIANHIDQRPATYTQHHNVLLPEGAVGLQCEADWSVEFRLYVSGWAGQERKDLGLYGLSFFSRIFKDSAIRSEAQAGIWGQWLQPNNSHPFSSLGSIEGGIFSDDKMGRSYYPKYMASGATHLYNGNSSIMGWGFYEKRVGCGYLGGVQIANTLVVPPNLISFDEDQDTHEDEGGLFFGHAWLALPFIKGKQRENWSV